MKTPTTNDKRLPQDMEDGIDAFVAHLCESYVKMALASELTMSFDGSLTKEGAIEAQRKCYEVEIKRNLAHIWKYNGQKSSVAWIVLADRAIAKDKKAHIAREGEVVPVADYFVRGDILKSATWKAPAKNFARGNVVTDKVFPRWHWNGYI